MSDAPTPALRAYLLGPPEVLCAGRRVAIGRRANRTVFYRLATDLEPVGRDRLCFLFWPDMPDAEARRALSRALSQIRGDLPEPEALDSDGERVWLDPARCWSDTAALRRLVGGRAPGGLDDAALEAAAALFRGRFLEATELPAGVEVEDWARGMAEHFGDLERRIVAERMRRRERAGDYPGAIALGRRCLELEPADERVHRGLMRLMAQRGDRSGALAQFRRCAAILEREIGVGPEPATVEMYRSILDGGIVAAPDSGRGAVGARGRVAEPTFKLLEPNRATGTLAIVDRILLDALAPDRGLPEALERLLELVRGGRETLALPPDLARAVAEHAPEDLTAYRLTRLAAWARPRHRLDRRFVNLTLLVDRGASGPGDRWRPSEARYDDLGRLLAEAGAPSVVLLGGPGSGKSTLLRRFELDSAVDALQAASAAGGHEARDAANRVTFLVPLNRYRAEGRAGDAPDPADWLASEWRRRFPALPDLPTLLATGRMVLLLDGLNEMPSTSAGDLWRKLDRWRAFLSDLDRGQVGNRVVFTCRTLDYSASLSTVERPVPQARIEPLTDDRMRAFLAQHVPAHAERAWQALSGAPEQDLLRTPFFLRLVVDHVEAEGDLPPSRVGLLTRFVRNAMRREIERANACFADGRVVSRRDARRILQVRAWPVEHALPEEGALVPGLARLAYRMQVGGLAGEGAQVRVDVSQAREHVRHPAADAILEAGAALGVLEEDGARGDLVFRHQLLQEYFAARRMAVRPRFDTCRAEWCAAAIRPTVRETLRSLAPADPLPPLPGSGWEETVVLAAVMAAEPAAFVRDLMDANLPLAGDCAAQPALGNCLPRELVDELRQALVARSRDPAADLRARIAAGLALGPLGDPRFEPREGPHGKYLMPPLVAIPAGDYVIGSNDSPYPEEAPRHRVRLAAFELGRFPVTNAEYACFVEAGGYHDERWWDTAACRAWRRGEDTSAGARSNVRIRVAFFRTEPEMLKHYHEQGSLTDELVDLWTRRLAMGEDELKAHLAELFPDARHTVPDMWTDARFNNSAQPVVGVSWFEARAYCRWLSAQTGCDFHLPSEAMWEAAARGVEGRVFAWGDAFDPLRGNTVETHIRRTTPVGVFPLGDTPEGASDMTGNVSEWTCSLYGRVPDRPEFAYPYRSGDGREDPEAPPDVFRLMRVSSWVYGEDYARSSVRFYQHPANRTESDGFRVARRPGKTGAG